MIGNTMVLGVLNFMKNCVMFYCLYKHQRNLNNLTTGNSGTFAILK